MRLPKFRYAVLAGAVVGIAIPLLVYALLWLHILDAAGSWLLFIWPSSIILMATETLGYSAQAFAILALSIACNVLLYAIVFSLIWCLGWIHRAWRASLRDGTTI